MTELHLAGTVIAALVLVCMILALPATVAAIAGMGGAAVPFTLGAVVGAWCLIRHWAQH